MSSLTAVIMAAGDEQHLPDHYPTGLTEIDNLPLLARLTESLHSDDTVIWLLRDDDIVRWSITAVAAQLTPRPRIIGVPGRTGGAACTALLAIDAIDPTSELLLLSANEYLSIDLRAQTSRFRETDADVAVLTFDSIHPRYSYAAIDSEGMVTRVAEKTPISRNATAGVYWARRGSTMVAALEQLIRKGDTHEGRYYVAPALNQIVLTGGRVRAFPLPLGAYHPLKEPDQVARLERGDST